VGRHHDAEHAVTAVRAIRRRELVRIAAADLLGLAGPAQTREALTSLAAVTVQAALAAAVRKVEHELGAPLPTRMCVVAMGRFGGHECGYASDADVMFVHDPLPAAGAGREPGGSAAAGTAAERRVAREGGEPGERGAGRQRGADEAATRAAHAVAEELRTLLALPAPDPPLLIDPGLRPEGRQGPLVRTPASYRAYYRRWSAGWE